MDRPFVHRLDIGWQLCRGKAIGKAIFDRLLSRNGFARQHHFHGATQRWTKVQ